jgi:hypothetical protein
MSKPRATQADVIHQIRNILGGTVMRNGFANGPDKITILVRPDMERKARELLASSGPWPYVIDVTSA